MDYFIDKGFSYLTFDMSGCGVSDGDHITLG
jgi:hypothetical protein